jgi:sugar phosphate isomerase/epimerase
VAAARGIADVKLGVFMMHFNEVPLEEALDVVRAAGVHSVEIGCGAYAGDGHCKPGLLLEDPSAIARLREAVLSRGLEISALSAQGNPVHPDPSIAEAHRKAVRDSIVLASKLGVKTFVAFSGLPGGVPGDRAPNWIVWPWPASRLESLKWQWEKMLIPYWWETIKFAEDHGVRVAFELHPDDCVYNVETLLRLREAVGSRSIGATVDPSHLVWQGVDPVQAIRALGDAVFHFHAKDTFIDPIISPVNGNLDPKPFEDVSRRSWHFCTVGYGCGEEGWRKIVRALRLVGYDGVLSIEHEDALMPAAEGLEKAVRFLRPIMIEGQFEA